MLRKIVPFFAILAAFACTPASQTPAGSFNNERVHEEAKVRIRIPQGWVVDDGTPNVLIIHDPKSEVGVLFHVTEAKDGAAALEEVTKGVLSEVSDVEVQGEESTEKINGMDAWSINAKGKSDGKDVDIALGFVLTPSGKMMIILAMAESGKLESHMAEWTEIFDNLRPLE